LELHRREVAHVLRVMANLLEIKGEEPFKVRSYEKVAESIENTGLDLETLAREGRLKEIPGIGKNLEPKIAEMVLTGSSSFLERLVQEVPPGLLDLLRVPGIGPKTARVLHETLGVKDLSDLEKVLMNHGVSKVPGLGPKRESLISSGLAQVKKYLGRALLGLALPTTESLVDKLAEFGVRAEIVGEARRFLETVSSMDLLLEETPGEDPVFLLEEAGLLLRDRAASPRTAQNPAGRDSREPLVVPTQVGVPLRIFWTPDSSFWVRALFLTGPEEHLKALGERAKAYGYRVSQEGLFRDGQRVPVTEEEDLYRALEMSFIPPEVRHRREFWDAAVSGKEITLVDVLDIKGDLHLHTTWSDGVSGIREMVATARSLGYSYVAITDHATSMKVVGGLDRDKIQAQLAEIDKVSRENPDMKILSGVEVDILKDGSLFLPDDILSRLDLVVASVHEDVGDARGNLKDRLIAAIRNPNVDIIGHPTGRLIGRRGGYPGDFAPILEAAKEYGTALEINASFDRLDLSEEEVSLALSKGVKLVVSTDAHSPKGMSDMRFGVLACLRRAGASPAQVLNTRDLVSFYPLK